MVAITHFVHLIEQKLLFHFMEIKKNVLKIIRKLILTLKKLRQKFIVLRYLNFARIFIKFALIFVVDKVIVLMVNANALIILQEMIAVMKLYDF